MKNKKVETVEVEKKEVQETENLETENLELYKVGEVIKSTVKPDKRYEQKGDLLIPIENK